LTIRKAIWKVQMIGLLIAGIVGFPSTLLVRVRDKLLEDPVANAEMISRVDKWTLYMFISGLFKDHGTVVQN
jgi:hypothetical protein